MLNIQHICKCKSCDPEVELMCISCVHVCIHANPIILNLNYKYVDCIVSDHATIQVDAWELSGKHTRQVFLQQLLLTL